MAFVTIAGYISFLSPGALCSLVPQFDLDWKLIYVCHYLVVSLLFSVDYYKYLRLIIECIVQAF